MQKKGENRGSFKKCLGVPKISSYSPEASYRKLESTVKIKERDMMTLINRKFWKIKQSFEGENIEKLLVEIRENLSRQDEEKDIHDKDIYLLGFY